MLRRKALILDGRDLMNEKIITIVSGLPRSGTSMMMQVLEAGGMEILTDKIRRSDEGNPKGYYELEAVKRLDKDQSCLDNAEGKTVKVISELLKYLPPKFRYRVIFVRRNMEEILASQKQMLIRQGKPTDSVSDEKLSRLFERHLERVLAWIEQQPNIDVLCVNYNEILKEPEKHLGNINEFLGNALNMKRLASVVDRALYRHRR
jgi:hypothetical protein